MTNPNDMPIDVEVKDGKSEELWEVVFKHPKTGLSYTLPMYTNEMLDSETFSNAVCFGYQKIRDMVSVSEDS